MEAPPPAVDAAPVQAFATDCVADGYLTVEVYGDLQSQLAWRGAPLHCEGMPRPNDAGARLRFSGPLGDNGQRLAFIIALPELEPGAEGKEFPAKITMIQEDSGRFYSNGDNETCWSDVKQQSSHGGPQSYTIEGIVYCVAPLAELNGNGNVTLRDLSYAGRVNWQVAE